MTRVYARCRRRARHDTGQWLRPLRPTPPPPLPCLAPCRPPAPSRATGFSPSRCRRSPPTAWRSRGDARFALGWRRRWRRGPPRRPWLPLPLRRRLPLSPCPCARACTPRSRLRVPADAPRRRPRLCTYCTRYGTCERRDASGEGWRGAGGCACGWRGSGCPRWRPARSPSPPALICARLASRALRTRQPTRVRERESASGMGDGAGGQGRAAHGSCYRTRWPHPAPQRARRGSPCHGCPHAPRGASAGCCC